MTPNGQDGKTASSTDYDWFWNQLDVHLAKHQLKQTKQRRLIVQSFIDLNDHISAEDLHESIRSAGHNIGLATIYRTLNLLSEAGLVEQKNFGDGRQLFEVCQPGEHHDHLVCVDCGKVIEFENHEIEKLQEKVAQEFGLQLVDHELMLFGRCQDLAKAGRCDSHDHKKRNKPNN